ncbi:hypothetical protein AB0N29_01875 [Nocardioides sp. NPDC092400]|uniref:hypothetical protein n=1 Tax=Nocardioides sp. NPDC092400 TaxID=3155196 RepID=UPI00341F4FC5
MQVNPHYRAAAARLLLDAVSAIDVEGSGSEESDEMMLLALAPLKLDLEQNPKTAATVAAAFDLLWFLASMQGKSAGLDRRTIVANMREYVLPQAYPEAYEN